MNRVAPFFVCLSLVGITLMAGCVHIPPGPEVMARPGTGKSFDVFEHDDAVCRDWARYRCDLDTRRANGAAVANTAVSTMIGAATGALIGAAAGDPGIGAAVGAGVGLLGGTAVAADQSNYASWSIQQRYDHAYLQCMYAKGNQVPAPRSSRIAAAYTTPPPPPSRAPRRQLPPPPRGRPPQPPPGLGY